MADRRMDGRTKPGTLLKHHIPIKTDHWDVTEPGFTEVDLPTLTVKGRAAPWWVALPSTSPTKSAPAAARAATRSKQLSYDNGTVLLLVVGGLALGAGWLGGVEVAASTTGRAAARPVAAGEQ